MFYVWGHSYEFDNGNNWERIETFTEYMGHRDDIWYATNIEIYDYMQAYSKLQMSCNQNIIHNPSAIPVWFESDEKIYCIEPRETIGR